MLTVTGGTRTMTHDLLIRGGLIQTGEGAYHADIAISDGRIAAIGSGLSARETIDAGGLTITPGGVDPHCHIEQRSGMGVMNADTFETATRSAAMGGTTTVISFAAQMKGERLRDTVADYAARARRGASIDHAFHLSLSDPDVPHFEDDLHALIGEGHRSVKVFTTYNIRLSDDQIERILKIAGPSGALTCVHAEDDATLVAARTALIAQGRTAPRDHAPARPRDAEILAVARLCDMAERTRAPVMIFHVSTAEAAAEIRAARARGAPVWAETCPHYLFMTEEVLDKPGMEGAKWMCSPPQRTTADQAALWHALKLGDLQVISSDHAPYRFDETGKFSAGPTPTFPEIANGMPGLEPRQPLLFDAMVSGDKLGAAAFVSLTATQPARLYGLASKGGIAPGADADLVLWDPTRRHIYGANDLHDNVGYNPYEGHTVTGWPVMVFLRGTCIVDDGVFQGRPGNGTWLNRDRIGTV